MIYTAGPWKDREDVKIIAEKLINAGYAVNARWLFAEETPPEGKTQEEHYRDQALDDMMDCIAADVLVYCNTGTLSEGKATELGMSLALLKPIVVVGEGRRANNIFLHLNLPFFVTVEEAIEWMKSEQTKAELAHGAR